jgi:hypothetical protein
VPASIEALRGKHRFVSSEEPNYWQDIGTKAVQKAVELCLPPTKTWGEGLTYGDSEGSTIRIDIDDDVEDYFIKFGGKPYWIQDEEEIYAGKLIKDGYEYFLQIDEDGYLPNMVKGNYPFCFGALYIYGKIENKNIGNLIAGFWQK